jgi:hypothetical protein
MKASWIKTRKTCRSVLSRFNELNGRHEETRTPDLYRDAVRENLPEKLSSGSAED